MPGPYGPGRSGEGNEPVTYVVVTGPDPVGCFGHRTPPAAIRWPTASWKAGDRCGTPSGRCRMGRGGGASRRAGSTAGRSVCGTMSPRRPPSPSPATVTRAHRKAMGGNGGLGERRRTLPLRPDRQGHGVPGHPVDIVVLPGQAYDLQGLPEPMECRSFGAPVGDGAFDADRPIGKPAGAG